MRLKIDKKKVYKINTGTYYYKLGQQTAPCMNNHVLLYKQFVFVPHCSKYLNRSNEQIKYLETS